MLLQRVRLAVLLLLVLSLQLNGCHRGRQEVRQTEFLLDTAITITAYGPKAEEAVTAAMAEIRRVAGLLDANAPGSEVSAINNSAGQKPVVVSEEVFALLEKCQYYSALTGGAFDITVRPLVELWAIGTEREQVPALEELEQALDLVDYKKVVLERQTMSVFLPESGMGIDLGGAGKGYAADRAREVLEEYGIESALIDAGGNIWALGPRPDGNKWRIGIRHPRPEKGQSVAAIVPSQGLTIVTSGDYERYFIQEGIRYHHIFDPETGFPARKLFSATVIGENSVEADILSTAVFVLGADAGQALIQQLPHLTTLVVTPELDLCAAGLYRDQLQFLDKEGRIR